MTFIYISMNETFLFLLLSMKDSGMMKCKLLGGSLEKGIYSLNSMKSLSCTPVSHLYICFSDKKNPKNTTC